MAKQLGVTESTATYIVEGWFSIALRLLGDGHTVCTPIGRIKTRRADARRRRNRGHVRDLKIRESKKARRVLDRVTVSLTEPDLPAPRKRSRGR